MPDFITRIVIMEKSVHVFYVAVANDNIARLLSNGCAKVCIIGKYTKHIVSMTWNLLRFTTATFFFQAKATTEYIFARTPKATFFN